MLKRLLLTLLAVGSVIGVAHAAGVYTASGEIQSLTRSSPLIDPPTASEKLSLQGVKKIRATMCSCTTSTCAPGAYPDPGPNSASKNGWFTGGTLGAWYEQPDAGHSSNPDLTLTVGIVDGGCRTWPDIESPAGNSKGTMMFATQGVTLTYTDGGNFVKVMLEGISQ